MAKDLFTKYDADVLVAASKFIKAIPAARPLDSQLGRGLKIQSEVYDAADSNNMIKGLVVMAKARHAPRGIPHPTPSCALEWYGSRIRGLNYELRHDNPNGTFVRGWHEHIWSPKELDAHVVEASRADKEDAAGRVEMGSEKVEYKHS